MLQKTVVFLIIIYPPVHIMCKRDGVFLIVSHVRVKNNEYASVVTKDGRLAIFFLVT